MVLCASSCKRRERPAGLLTEEENPRLASIVHVSDPRTASQLLAGFHAIEQNAWRWTQGRFAVMLRTPRKAAERGATLWLKFVVPEAVIQKLNTVSLSAYVGGAALPPESYTQSGEFTYSRELPARVLAAENVRADFSLDKSVPPSGLDQRELGVIVTAVGLEAR